MQSTIFANTVFSLKLASTVADDDDFLFIGARATIGLKNASVWYNKCQKLFISIISAVYSNEVRPALDNDVNSSRLGTNGESDKRNAG